MNAIRRRHPSVTILLWLLVGAAAALVEAWTAALLPPLTFAHALTLPSSRPLLVYPWPYPAPEGFRTPIAGNRTRTLLADLDLHTDASREPLQAITAWRFGFPFRSLAGWQTEVSPIHAPEAPLSREWHGAFPLGTWRGLPVLFPLFPLWSGLVANTLIFGALGWLLIGARPAFRRWSRRRAGRCLACGYDRRGLDPSIACPECGRPALG